MLKDLLATESFDEVPFVTEFTSAICASSHITIKQRLATGTVNCDRVKQLAIGMGAVA